MFKICENVSYVHVSSVVYTQNVSYAQNVSYVDMNSLWLHLISRIGVGVVRASVCACVPYCACAVKQKDVSEHTERHICVIYVYMS